jgi:integrase
MTSPPKRLVNAKSVEALKPRRVRYEVADAEVRGLVLRVSPDGRKTWALRYQVGTQARRMKLGEYGPHRLSLADARMEANKLLRRVDGGKDPVAERREAARMAAQAKRDTIEALCHSYIEKHARPLKRTWRDDQGKINTEILPKWKGRAVSSITREDCEALVQGIADRQKPGGKGVYANRVAALLSTLFGFAVKKAKLIKVNIAWQLDRPGIEISARPQAEHEDKPYDEDEVRAIWKATESLEPAPRALFRLGLLTGQRPGEISGMTWNEIDGDWWTIPASRAKNNKTHRVFLVAPALKALEDVPRVEGEARVFAGYRGKRQIAELNAKVFAGLRPRSKARHVLRDTAATGMAAAGVKVEDVSHVLNHSVGLRVTAGYNAYAYDAEKRRALLRWERRLRAILAATVDDADRVVAFTPRA